MCWNMDGMRALLEHRDPDVDLADMVSVSDDTGRLPIHWAAAGGLGDDEIMFPAESIAPRVIDTFKLLLTSKPDMINVRDKDGKTALLYAVEAHAGCNPRHLTQIATFLCENGADASICDNKGQSVFHRLAFCSLHGDIIEPSLIDVLVAHGARIEHVDENGVTALHVMARNLPQIEAAKYLLKLGADFTAKEKSKGNTPLHFAAMHPGWAMWDPRVERPESQIINERIRVQDEIMGVLLEAGGSEMMDQPNAEGMTPRQLAEKARAQWWEDEARYSAMRK